MSGEYAAVRAGSAEVLLSAMLTNFRASYSKTHGAVHAGAVGVRTFEVNSTLLKATSGFFNYPGTLHYLSLAERLIGGLTATTLVQNDQHDAIRKMRIVLLLLITFVGLALGKLERDEIFVCETI